MRLSFACTKPTIWPPVETTAMRGFHLPGEMEAKKKSGLALERSSAAQR
jgi:hypothetical protein